jgi:queuine tRNA-ribosyltransferase
MAAQIGLGADIIMAFDECTEYPADAKRLRDSMELTLRWARRSKKYFEEHKNEVPWGSTQHSAFSTRENARYIDSDGRALKLEGTGEHGSSRQPRAAPAFGESSVRGSGQAETGSPVQALFGIVQGGMDRALRKESAERTIEIGFDGYAIGGLSVGEPRELTREIIAATLPLLPKDKPRYVMGVGYPEEIVEYAAMGVDMMDCVLPTRAARHGLLFTSEGRMNIKNARFARDQEPADPKCGCMVCSRYTRAYLRHLFVSGEPLAAVLNTIHNLAHYLDTMRSVRHAIRLGEMRAKQSDSSAVSEQTS